ncbi:MAG: hypothetical protein Q4A15_03110 [Prevotellaceae bacterium]|nr:hypothetical protein [Prevotellaceae bacterium]
MTTIELIEKHGIGHNCLADAYELGRKDAERDFQNSEYWNDYLQKIISDAKADAIDELLNNVSESIIWDVLAELMIRNISVSEGAKKVIDYLQKVAEELKEKRTVRTYDDNGNVVDLVEWEKKIKSDAIQELIRMGLVDSLCLMQQ